MKLMLEHRVVILDRDGVINEDSDNYIKSPEEWVPIPGSIDAIAKLNQAGFRIFVITNQSGISRNMFSYDTLHRIHQKMHDYIDRAGGKIEGILFCPHVNEDNCTCRKPYSGLFLQLQEALKISLEGIPAIGDSWRDIQAASSVKAYPILVKTGKGLLTFSVHSSELSPNQVAENLSDAVDRFILSQIG